MHEVAVRTYAGSVKLSLRYRGIDFDPIDIISHASTEDADYLRSWAGAVLQREELSDPARVLIEITLVPFLLERLNFWRFQDKAFPWLDSLPDTLPNGVFDEYQEEKATWHQLVDEISAQYGKQEITLHLTPARVVPALKNT